MQAVVLGLGQLRCENSAKQRINPLEQKCKRAMLDLWSLGLLMICPAAVVKSHDAVWIVSRSLPGSSARASGRPPSPKWSLQLSRWILHHLGILPEDQSNRPHHLQHWMAWRQTSAERHYSLETFVPMAEKQANSVVSGQEDPIVILAASTCIQMTLGPD